MVMVMPSMVMPSVILVVLQYRRFSFTVLFFVVALLLSLQTKNCPHGSLGYSLVTLIVNVISYYL